jgi:hypothetical protein
VSYFAVGRSPIQPPPRIALVVGGLAVYVALATLGYVVGA